MTQISENGQEAAPQQQNLLPRTLSQTRLQELLSEVQRRIEDIVGSNRSRMDSLLGAVLAVSAGLDLDVTLRQIVHAATDLVGLRDDLLQAGLDCWQVAELVGSFRRDHPR